MTSFKRWLISEVKQFTGLNDSQIAGWTSYAGSRLFRSPEEARQWLFDRLQFNDKQSYVDAFGGANGEDFNRAFAAAMPIYQSGKSFKIGKPIRKDYRLRWKDFDIRSPSWEYLVRTAQANGVEDFEIHGIKLIPIRNLLGKEKDTYSYGKESEYIVSLAAQIKQNKWFEAIVYDVNEMYVIEGQHRVRAARLLKFSSVPGIGIEYVH